MIILVTIVFSGPPGGGKTTYAKMLAEHLGLRYYSAGKIFRRIAEERGLSIEELSLLAARDPSIDLEIDRVSYEEALKGNVVLDGHLVAWIVADVADIKIYVTAPLIVRVKRISMRDNVSFEKALRETIIRENVQRERFMRYYGIDVYDLSIFDLVISSENLSIDEVFDIIKDFVEKNLKH